MKAIRAFWAELTLKPQGFTMIIAGFLPVFAIIAMFPVVASIIGHFHDDPNAAIKVPAMVTAPGYAIALLAPFAGVLCDRFGRRRILLACTFFYGVAGTAPFFLESLDSIIATRLALGVCEAGILTIVNTLIADYWADRSRRNWLMLQGIVGPALQPAVFVLVASVAAVRWNGGFLVYLVAFPIFLSMYFFLFEPKREQVVAQEGTSAVEAPGPFPAGAAMLVAAVTLFASVLYYVFIVNGSIAWKEVGVTDPLQVSTLTVIPALFIVVGSILFRLVSRFNNAVQIASFLGMLGLGLAAIGLARSVTSMQLGMTLQQTGAGMAIPALIAWSQSKFGFAHRGRGMGVWTSAFFLGQAISPIIVGNIAGAAGSMQGAFLALGLVGICGAAVGFGLGTRAPLRVAAA
ncbi:MFS transporter [Sphingomonas sp. TDK1]|uniref:MFS transporter n=1 Tax=Sphingomonas sp. TDK1 TaxID=453247 RepID=UPI0007D9044B|nr:MFS transporter [Sphingomonas sp. TDK1]OAN63152.1 MFS transporter [Sphingomonas sp. TDK1]